MPALVPEFDQLVEYVTEGPVIHAVALAAQPLENPLSLGALADGYAQVTAWGRLPTLTASDVTAIKDAITDDYHQDVIEHEVVSTNPALIVDQLAWVCEHPLWGVGLPTVMGQVWMHAGNLYRCLQSHTTQSDWSPATTPALWVRYYDAVTILPWVQPVGGHDAYILGAKVTHAGHTYTSLIPANVWEPGSVGADSLWHCEDCAPPVGIWAVGVAYQVNAHVMHLGTEYRCLQAHTSIASWSPTSPGILGVLWALT